MPRRSTRQRNIDDNAFPLRLKVRLPPEGLGGAITDAIRWLDAEVGRGDYAQHPSEMPGGYATAFYFRRAEDLVRFLQAFPNLELADATISRAYTSPLFPFGGSQG